MLSIVILNYNTSNLTLQCLKSLIEQYHKALKEKEIEIILVDNHSSDDSIKAFELFIKDHPYIQLIENQENMGFSKGCNIGAKKAKGEYIVFLNSDTQVIDMSLLKMINFAETHTKSAVIGGRLKNIDGSIQESVGKFYTLSQVLLVLFGGRVFNLGKQNPTNEMKVDWVSGAYMLVKKDIFDKVGGFDETIFMYVEDMDFCYRVKKMGYDVWFYPYSKIIHKERGSSNRSFAIVEIYKGILHFYTMHKTRGEYVIVKILLILKAEMAIVVGYLTNNTYLVETYKKALQIAL